MLVCRQQLILMGVRGEQVALTHHPLLIGSRRNQLSSLFDLGLGNRVTALVSQASLTDRN